MAQQPPGGYPPQQPPGGYPPQPPGGSPGQPPPGAYGQPAYPQAYRPPRPGSVTAAGVLLIILGAFAALGGIFVVIGGIAGGQILSQFGGQFANVSGAATAIGVVAGLLMLTYAVFKIISGAKVFALRNGWRITGIVLSAIAVVGWLLILIGSFQGQETSSLDPTTFEFTTVSTGPNIGGIIFALIFLSANAITIVLLARSGEAFRRT
jgi:hypothetical protein